VRVVEAFDPTFAGTRASRSPAMSRSSEPTAACERAAAIACPDSGAVMSTNRITSAALVMTSALPVDADETSR
jgi:hypothetical protein